MIRKASLTGAIILCSFLLATAANTSDDSEVSIGVVEQCGVGIKDFEAPQGGYLGRNGTGSFEAVITNNGSYSNTTVNASMDFKYMSNVTNQSLQDPESLNLSNISDLYSENLSNSSEDYIGNYTDPNSSTEYEFGALSNDTQDFINRLEVPRELNLSLIQNETEEYQVKRDFDNFTRRITLDPANRSTNYIKFFDAIPEYPYNEYNATLNVNYTCQAFNATSGRTNRLLYGFIDDTIDFSIVRAAGGVAEEGDQTSNETIPQDVDREGESSDNPLEGDDSNPGQTPEPEPEPEPEPQPEPEPGPRLELEPLNRTYVAERNQPKQAGISVRNVGETNISDITLQPELSALEDWTGNNASVTNIGSGERLNRSLVVTPPQSADPGVYTVPVIARTSENMLDTDYMYIDVKQTSFEPSFRILEAPRNIEITEGSTQEFPILIENVGRSNLTNLTAEVQNLDQCGEITSPTVQTLEPNETTSLSLDVEALNSSESCESTLLVSSQDGAFAYSNLGVTVSPEQGLIPERQQPPMLAIIWTALLVGYAVLRKRIGTDSMSVNAPLILLIIGETVILLYLVVGHYGLVSVPFLPF